MQPKEENPEEKAKILSEGKDNIESTVRYSKTPDTLQERCMASGMNVTTQEYQGRLEDRIGNPQATTELLNGKIFECIRHPGNHQDSLCKAAQK